MTRELVYDVPIQSVDHALYCLEEAQRRYYGSVIIDEFGMYLVEEDGGCLHTDDVLRAISVYFMERKQGMTRENETIEFWFGKLKELDRVHVIQLFLVMAKDNPRNKFILNGLLSAVHLQAIGEIAADLKEKTGAK